MQCPAFVDILTNRSNSVLYNLAINTLNTLFCEHQASRASIVLLPGAMSQRLAYYGELDPKDVTMKIGNKR